MSNNTSTPNSNSGITGHYIDIEIDGTEQRVYYEENGPKDGIPLLCQHTAGSHGQQWRHLLTDEDITDEYRVIAPDLPYHGKSIPPTDKNWWEEDYILTEEKFAEFIVGVADKLSLEDPIFLGSSMGGNVVLQLGDWHPDRFQALIGMGSSVSSNGYFVDWLHHPEVNGSEVSAYICWGLMAPQSPEQFRRETMHFYEQQANGIFRGDLYYYAVDHDYTGRLDEVDPNCPVYVMNGEYDWVTDPEYGREVADGIGEQATAMEMGSMGHFPMSENPPLFKQYLTRVLADIRGEDVELPEVLTPEAFGLEPTDGKPKAD